jgi:hypothetical protein
LRPHGEIEVVESVFRDKLGNVDLTARERILLSQPTKPSSV